MSTTLKELIEDIEKDDLPTNEFTIEDEDPMVILGKINEVIAYLQTLQDTINSSDSKANEALQKAIEAVADATQALSVANGIDAKATQALANAIEAVGTANTALSASNTALSTANTAISTANTAISSANSAVETAEVALDSAESAETKADTAITTANGAKTTAEGIDDKATTALSNSQTAVSTANEAKSTAQEALDQVVSGLGTKVYRDTTLLNSLDIKPIEDDIVDNATAITALQNGKVDKVAGKQLSTEDFTTAEKNKLAELNNYDDTQLQADISTLMTDVEEMGNELNTTNANLNIEATARENADTNLQNQVNNKLEKVTYEFNKELSFGSTGILFIGAFPIYDTSVVIDISSTTNTTYSGKVLFACQNYKVLKASVFGDYSNTITPNIYYYVENNILYIYFTPASWSKNNVHIKGCAIRGEPTNIMTNVASLPSQATNKPINEFTNVVGYTKGTYRTGGSTVYYEKYNDGRLHYRFRGNTGLSSFIFTFPIPFIDNNYSISLTAQGSKYCFYNSNSNNTKVQIQANQNNTDFSCDIEGYWK